jgi:hypothetical protein
MYCYTRPPSNIGEITEDLLAVSPDDSQNSFRQPVAKRPQTSKPQPTEPSRSHRRSALWNDGEHRTMIFRLLAGPLAGPPSSAGRCNERLLARRLGLVKCRPRHAAHRPQGPTQKNLSQNGYEYRNLIRMVSRVPCSRQQNQQKQFGYHPLQNKCRKKRGRTCHSSCAWKPACLLPLWGSENIGSSKNAAQPEGNQQPCKTVVKWRRTEYGARGGDIICNRANICRPPRMPLAVTDFTPGPWPRRTM